jgi:hypothetical protein
MRTHSRLATDNRRQDTTHRRANNAVEKLLTLAALTKLLEELRRIVAQLRSAWPEMRRVTNYD